MSETKLGLLIDENSGRDAVHIALAPVQANEDLEPGDHIGLVNGNEKLAGKTKKTIGIVDPYLPHGVKKHQWFFMALYPQTTTGLRHVWTHPAFTTQADPVEKSKDRSASLVYLEGVADNCNVTYRFLMESARKWLQYDDYTVQQGGEDWRDGFPYPADEFWTHYEIVTGEKVSDKTATFFSCSC